MNYVPQLRDYLETEQKILAQLDLDSVSTLMNLMEEARQNHKRIFICGNGGSAATASHFVCDFCKGVSLNQEVKYDFECLSDNTPLMTAIANDISYDDVFVIPLKAKLHQGDLVIGISGSGNSENVVRAIRYAREHGAKTVALVGYSGGKLLQEAEHAVHVNIDNMQIVEDVHMILDHMMMYVLASLNEQQ
ncbi:SIS domain-containing protein [Pseudoflavonifractor sp. AF19-9AC]|uniref:SIS domain-containing protein n=1 Tax=Pseudoflavonifractor sp. AF19-9AC TaxID=2292244 RepID=UPI000E54E52E|nr:SIS domain-containing protein [Pseudoflavonifractor sp. AF19-9AC]RHR06677.1 SIS domain-containing protein [Pseudoflavonifractor sp. AF19-9AC]